MRLAVLTDIHANLQALDAVLVDIGSETDVDGLVCLGDIIGYAGNPAECVDRIRASGALTVQGNHDWFASTTEPRIRLLFENPEATDPVSAGIRHALGELSEDQLDWLRSLPMEAREERADAIFAHAALHDAARWPYLHSPLEATPTLEILDQIGAVGFFGHTHLENIFYDAKRGAPEHRSRESSVLPAEGCFAVTVGATGQPRSGDPRAHWIVWDSETREVSFRRTPYDIDAAADAIRSAGLPARSADRLYGF